ncbi:hypothetical protein, partial [Pseudoalteromonas sp. T1lg88]|uniref:hypothetical protein n=1 Tax=Pseudoalteromonas sp. T1lg88 TaxID=2077104 RepID=UPI001F2D7C79
WHISLLIENSKLFKLNNSKFLSAFQIFKEQENDFSELNTLYSQGFSPKECLSIRRSSKVVELSRIELLTSCVQGTREA